jgi:uncharacterized membrane protein
VPHGSFFVLIISFVLLAVFGHFGVPFSYGWGTSLSFALAGMFLLTASAHWGKRRPDLIRMVPSAFPRADMLVTATGILEIVGAVGLMIPTVARYAAVGLFLLLIAVFPANVRAARNRLAIAGRPTQELLPRTLIQIAFLTATFAIAVGTR